MAQVLGTGCYPDMERRTGRTTAIALSTIAEAIRSPGVPVPIKDHHPSANQHLAMQIHEYISVLKLQHLHVRPRQLTLTFERK